MILVVLRPSRGLDVNRRAQGSQSTFAVPTARWGTTGGSSEVFTYIHPRLLAFVFFNILLLSVAIAHTDTMSDQPTIRLATPEGKCFYLHWPIGNASDPN